MTVLRPFAARRRTSRRRLAVPKNKKPAPGRRRAEAPDAIARRQTAAAARRQRGAVDRWRDRGGSPARSVSLVPVAECIVGKEVTARRHFERRCRTGGCRLAVQQDGKTARRRRAEAPDAVSCSQTAAAR